jgi:exodeoxyribonuclease VII small subunit
MTMAEDKNADIASMPFEAALAELERIVTDLERGEVPLEKSVEMYERGERLKARCEALLRQAEERVEKIRLGPDGKAAGAEPFDVD